MGQHYWHECTILQITLRFYVDRHVLWLCQMAWFCIYVTESLVHISSKWIIMRTNITSFTRVHFRRLSRSAEQKWLHCTVNSNQWKHPRRSKHYFDIAGGQANRELLVSVSESWIWKIWLKMVNWQHARAA